MKLLKLQAQSKTTTKSGIFVSALFTLMSNCATVVPLAGFVGFPRVSMKQGLQLHLEVEIRGDLAWFQNKLHQWKKALAVTMRRPYLYELCHLSTRTGIPCSQAPEADISFKQTFCIFKTLWRSCLGTESTCHLLFFTCRIKSLLAYFANYRQIYNCSNTEHFVRYYHLNANTPLITQERPPIPTY